MRPADELVRVIRRSDGTLDVGRALPGRGAWLCAESIRCVDLAARRRAFERALRGPVERDAVDAVRAALTRRARMVAATGDGSELPVPDEEGTNR